MATLTPNYGLSMPDATDDFKDFRASYNSNMGIIDNNMGGGGGSGGHTIIDENDTSMAQRTGLQFTGNVTVTDDAVNNKTIVDIQGDSGGGIMYLNTIYSTEEKMVGYWTDGKPLYQKTWDLGSDLLVNSNTWTDTSIRVSDFNIENIIHASGLNSGGSFFGFVASNRDQTYVQILQTRNAQITVRYFTLRYTKTTDTPELNPQVGNVIYLPTIYSDEEREIGVWRDGKPLYQRTYDLGSEIAISNTSWQALGISTSGFGMMPKCSGIASDGSFQSELLAWNNNGTLYVMTPRNSTGYVQYITLQYTKTTDIAGSGDWNTDGVPTVHYDTSEKVIGTWVTGKPLYQKTFNISSSIPQNTTYVVGDITNFDLVEVHGIALLGTGAGFNMPYYNSANEQCQIWWSSNELKIYQKGYTVTGAVVTIRYTKTTD